MMSQAPLSGVNGERATVIKWCLMQAAPDGEPAYEIADFMAKFRLLEFHGRTEKVRAVLRALEARGEVVRVRVGRRDRWRLTDGDEVNR